MAQPQAPPRRSDPAKSKRRARSDGLRITKVGLWFLIFSFIVLVAATNTGNNGLFLVLAMMGGAFIVSHVLGSQNLRNLGCALDLPPEIFANTMAHIDVSLENQGRFLPRWLLVTTLGAKDVAPPLDQKSRRLTPLLVPFLPAGRRSEGRLELMFRRRGRHRIRGLQVQSLFPLGFFHKSVHYAVDHQLVIFPEIFPYADSRPTQTGKSGEESTRRQGWGHDLLGLRPYRHGDDPRSIHWKQTARTGDLIFKEHETEENRRLLILFDNAVGELDTSGQRRFERLVSEAATTALQFLEDGFEVALQTRGTSLPFATGGRQRFLVLETLALIEPVDSTTKPLETPTQTPHLRLSMEAVA